MKSQKRYKVKA